jgi:SET domain-containing protein
MRFINDNNHYNCEAISIPYYNIWTIFIISTRVIYPGEEISLSYGDAFWKDHKKNNYHDGTYKYYN